jgi:L-methionine (R)-S-oxide reductase
MTNAHANPTDLISELNALAASATSAEALMKGVVAILHAKLTRYNWVGFHMLENEADRDMLVLAPFQGTMTPHTRIPLNQGICGAGASRGKTIVVDDVAADAR